MIHDLKRQGLSISAIARKLGLDRKTVRKHLEGGVTAPVYGPRQPRPRLLEAFEPYLRERILGFPDLSGRRLLREIRAGACYPSGSPGRCADISSLLPAMRSQALGLTRWRGRSPLKARCASSADGALIRRIASSVRPAVCAELIDISAIDFDALRAKFDAGNKRTEAERLRALLSQKLTEMVARNPPRADFLARFQKLIDSYNSGSQNIEAFFAALVKLANDLAEEEHETIREELSEEKKALFDILTKPEVELTEREREHVKVVARWLLQTLKDQKLVLDWTKKEPARGAVRQAIEVTLDQGLPDAYDETLFYRKCDTLYRHLFDAYQSGRDGIDATD